MTFATIDRKETTSINLSSLKALVTSVSAQFTAYRAERKELKSLYHYHSEKAAHLEQAQRDVNRVWLG